MRWYVEITPLGADEPEGRLCVEEGHWQGALRRARRLRGEREQLGGLSVDIVGQGCRAVDPALRLRYDVTVAPDDAPLDEEGDRPGAAAPATLGDEPGAAGPPARGRRALAQTMAFGSRGEVEQALERAEGASAKPGRPRTMAFVSPGEVVQAVDEAAREASRGPAGGATGGTEPPGTPVAPEELDDAPPPTVDYAARPAAAAAAAPSGGDRFQLISSREIEPSTDSPLRYREYVYGTSAPVPIGEAEAWLRRRFQAIRQELAGVSQGKVINIALFDHLFETEPSHPPMITLSWKDWRGEGPEVVLFPYGEGEAAAASAPPPSEPPAAAGEAHSTEAAAGPPSSRRRGSRRHIARRRSVPPSVPPDPAPAQSAPPSRPPSAPPAAPASSALPDAADDGPPPATEPRVPPAPQVPDVDGRSAPSPAADTTPATTERSAAVEVPDMTPEQRARSIPPRPSSPDGPRLAGDDLLTDLFEAMAGLHFLGDALQGADFVLALALEKLPCEAGLVSLFDINRRQYVVVRQAGGERSGVLLRLSQRAKLAQQAMRSARAVVVGDARAAPELVDPRWEQIGVTPHSLLCAPVEQSGRYLGLIELANPSDGAAFEKTDGHALTYIGRQFAEFVAERGVLLDPDLILEDIEEDGP